MSYVLSSVCIDIEKLQSAIRSGDTELVEAVVASDPEAFDQDDEDDDELSLTKALRQIIMGDKLDSDDAHQYGYALVPLCRLLGEDMPVDVWGGVRWAAVRKCKLGRLVNKTGPPIELPRSRDFPRVGHLRRDRVNKQLQKTRRRRGKEKNEEIQELLDEFIGWLEAASSRNLDLVFFYH